ncbi:hypothetical protein [Streptomyces sp. ME19-01-6]|uniref:hypothetical protein n=1 Tax=Streptomyces sp. ME19-01-6 TaxID=3028686 RepID=UPI0029CAA001|nr:hypothetical protein [Streptomyces sp. ME19-01-6]
MRGLPHTSGGIPVLPLALSGTNSTVGAVSTAALVGGGPIALAVAAGGAAVLGASAVIRARRRTERERRRTPAGASTRRGGSRRTPRRISAGLRGTGGASAGGRGRAAGGMSRTGAGTSGRRHGVTPSGRHAGRTASRDTTPRTSGGGRSAGARGGTGRIGQVRALRQARREQAPTRSAARQQTTAARRAVADARRDARAAARADRTPGRGRARRALGRTAGQTASGVRALVNRARAARDRSSQDQVAARRAQVRRAPARRRARWGLLRSAARFQGRRLLAALLALPVGVLGCLTTPLGRRLGWRWLMHPGRRLYRRLMRSAWEARGERDEQIRLRLAAEEAEADAAAEQNLNEIGDRVERPTHLIPTTDVVPGQEAIHVSGFNFEEAAAEMENAARSYEPDGNMEVLAMIEGLPQAMQSIANTFRILAERSDEEFAFEKDVAAGFDDIHRTLLHAVDATETLVPLFRSVHAQDIARHEDPRNGTEAEKGWNV